MTDIEAGEGSGKRFNTIQCILVASRRCLLRSGLDGTRVEDVVEGARIARSTFYRYFGGLDDVVARLAMDETLEAMHRAATEAERDQEGAPVQLARILATAPQSYDAPPITRLIQAEGAGLRLATLVITRPEMMRRMAAPFVRPIEQGQRGGQVRRDCSAAELAEWLARNMATLILLPPPNTASAGALEEYVLRFIIPGVLTVASDWYAATEQRLDQVAAAIHRVESLLMAATITAIAGGGPAS